MDSKTINQIKCFLLQVALVMVFYHSNKVTKAAGQMAQQLRVFVLAEDLGSSLSAHAVAYNHL